MGDVDVDGLNANDHLTPLFYTGSGLNRTNSGSQALEVTTLAVMPNGTRKMLQYVTVPLTFSLSFPSALTLLGSSGNNVQFTGPGTPSFYISGTDSVPVGACTPSSPPVFAIGYGNGSDASGIHASPPDKYSGAGGSSTVPSVGAVTLPASMQSVNGLNGLVQGIASSADAAFSPISPATAIYGSQLPSGMSASNPMTVVVNGDLDLTDWHGVGYGLLLVTGTLTYDPDATWNGIVLVIGKGNLVSIKGGVHQINGALFIAKTVDNSGNPLSSFGPASFSQTGVDPSGYGVYFSSCNISAAQQPTSYKVLSFREIPLAD
jgi:hypothetical protein